MKKLYKITFVDGIEAEITSLKVAQNEQEALEKFAYEKLKEDGYIHNRISKNGIKELVNDKIFYFNNNFHSRIEEITELEGNKIIVV